MNLLHLILSKLFPEPFDAPLSPSHRHALVSRDEMEQHPINSPDNWLPRSPRPLPQRKGYTSTLENR